MVRATRGDLYPAIVQSLGCNYILRPESRMGTVAESAMGLGTAAESAMGVAMSPPMSPQAWDGYPNCPNLMKENIFPSDVRHLWSKGQDAEGLHPQERRRQP